MKKKIANLGNFRYKQKITLLFYAQSNSFSEIEKSQNHQTILSLKFL